MDGTTLSFSPAESSAGTSSSSVATLLVRGAVAPHCFIRLHSHTDAFMPNSMSRQQERDLHIQISTLKSELELSTFLNKGVLQTNSEYKLRIVELERENAVLRVAESRLARTEDRLEAAEQRAEKEGRERTRLEEEREEWRKQRDLSGWQAKSWRGALERANSKLEGIGRLSVPEEVKEGPATVCLPRAMEST